MGDWQCINIIPFLWKINILFFHFVLRSSHSLQRVIINEQNYIFVAELPVPLNQRWSNIFGFDSDSNLFPRISNIRIRIREFWRPNNIRIFESFSSNLEYLKHIFHLDFEYKLVIFSCPADLLIPFSGTNGQDLCLDVTVTWYL